MSLPGKSCFVLLFLSLLALAMAAPTNQQPTHDEQWADFKAKYNRNFKTPEEEAERKATFVDTLLRIEKHNSEGHSWTMGVNQFADMNQAEREKFCCGSLPPRPLDEDETPGQN